MQRSPLPLRRLIAHSHGDHRPCGLPARTARVFASALLLFSVGAGAAFAAPAADLGVSAVDAPDPVVAGEQVTFTVTVTNDGPDAVSDAVVTTTLPAGLSAASTTGCAEDPAGAPTCTLGATLDPRIFRATEYQIAPGAFTGRGHNLTLDQDLAADYFVMVRGSSVDGGSDTGPELDYVRLSRDPFGTGDLSTSAGADVLRFRRGAETDESLDWAGVVTVVECLQDCDVDGFRLLTVDSVDFPASDAATSGSVTSGATWGSTDRLLLMGGIGGAGCESPDEDARDHKVCHARLVPSGTDQIDWSRSSSGANLDAGATATVMVVEWGSAWNVERARVLDADGTVGPNDGGVDATSEYETGAIGTVARANTWVWGVGFTDQNGVGDSAEGAVITLGDGVNQNASESTVAVGLEHLVALDFEVWAMEHPDLEVSHVFKADGDDTDLTVDVGVPGDPDGYRMAVSTNSAGQTNLDYPVSSFSARYESDTQIRLERRRQPSPFAAWVQGVDFSGVREPATAEVTVVADVAVDASSPVVSTFAVSSATDDPVAGNDSHDESTTVVRSADLSIAVGDSVDPVTAGDDLVFTVTVDNLGPSQAEGVVVASTLPPGVTLVATTGCPEDPNGVAECTLGAIAPGGDATFTVDAAVGTDQGGADLQFDATVSATSTDGNGANDSASESTAVTASSDLSVAGTARPAPAIAGGRLIVDLDVANLGPSDAPDTELTLAIDPRTTLVDVDGCDGGPAPPPTCELGTLSADGSVLVTLTLDVAEDATGRLEFPVSVASSVADSDGENDAVTVSVRVSEERVVGRGETPALSADLAGDGDLAVVWNRAPLGRGTADGVLLRRLDSAGMPVGVELRLDTLPSSATRTPGVIHLADGGLLAVWEAEGPDGDGAGVFARLLDAAGMPVGVEWQLNDSSSGDQGFPRIEKNGTGGGVVTWADTAAGEWSGLRLDSAGMPVGVEFRFGSTSVLRPADLLVKGDGSMIAVYENPSGHVVRRRLDSAGMPVGVELQLSAPGGGTASKPVLVPAGNRFVAVWENQGGDGSGAGIFARLLDAAGMPVGVEFRLNSLTAQDQSDPAGAGVLGGEPAIVWQGEDEDGRGVYTLRLDSAGMPVGVELRLNQSPDGIQAQPAVTPAADGTFHVAWQLDDDEIVAAPEPRLFTDGFESGDTSRW